MTKDAAQDLADFLDDGEVVEGIVFGGWGWGGGFREPEEPPVPESIQGAVLSVEEAVQYMHGWSFYGGLGSPDCYATYIWTDKRVIWVTQYDGETRLDSAPRHPSDCMPDMSGG